MFLCIGPRGAGKTALLDRLKSVECSLDSGPPVTVPTVGTMLTSIPSGVGSGSNHWRRKSSVPCLCVRELGGVMAPIWPKYYGTADLIKGIMFVVDASNPRQVSVAAVLLLSALSDKRLSNTPFLVVLNKVDACEPPWAPAQLRFLMRLNDVAEHARQLVAIVETSYKNGSSLKEIKQWMYKLRNSGT